MTVEELSVVDDGGLAPARLVSGDSHVIEPADIWAGLLDDGFWGDTAAGFSQRPGGHDPTARLDEMTVDGVVAEVLYPSLALRLFGLEDPALQESCFRRYNEWIGEYCSLSPDRLAAIGLVPAYDMERAVAEVQWCRDHGLRGVQVWQTPPPALGFAGWHHEPLWEACAALSMPVSLHILTGFDYSRAIHERGMQVMGDGLVPYRSSITEKLAVVMNAVFELILSGVLDRHPGLRFVLVENEVGWAPFVVDQLQYYYDRFRGKSPVMLERPPAEAFRDQFSATFFRDPHARFAIEALGAGSFLWSSDYPHGNSTWPHSREVVADTLGTLDTESLTAVTSANACALYGLNLDTLGQEKR